MRRRSTVAAVLAAFVAIGAGTVRAQSAKVPAGALAHNVEAVGYSEVDGKIPFKITINNVNDKWYLYLGSFWVRGWSILDVTNPAAPAVAKFVDGPTNTSTVQIDWAEGGLMETPVSRILPGRDFDETKPYDSGFYMWDLKDPLNPKKVGYWKSRGTHRNYYDGGKYVHATAAMEGYQGNIYVIVDVSDPANPKEAGRWWVNGQHVAGGEKPGEEGLSLHGPPIPVGNLVYLPYGGAGMIILDITDVAKPRFVSRLDFSPPFRFNAGHTVIPIPEKKIALFLGESIEENCEESLNATGIIDIADPKKPFLIAQFPHPVPPPGLPYTDFCDKGGRFGPHNVNTVLHSRFVEKQGDLVYMTWFNAGLRIYDISNPRLPKEVGSFVPPDPPKRYGPLPASKLVIQTNDVLVDKRGYIYLTDRNAGVWIVKYTGPRPAAKRPS